MGMTLADMEAAMKTEVGNASATTAQLDRAITKTVSLMSRLLPKRAIAEATIGGSVTDAALTIDTNTGTLTYAPIEEGTLVIKNSGGTTMVEGTNYTVNLLTGVVTEVGSALPDGSYTATYDRDPRVYKVSNLTSTYIKLERVEYPVGDEPPVNPTFEHIGDYLFFKGKDFALTEDEHIRLVYLTPWAVPGASAGDYQAHLDNAIIVGACGQYLIFEAEEHVVTAVTAVAALTAPTNYTITAPTMGTFPTTPAAYIFVKPAMGTLPTVPTVYSYSKPTSPTLPSLPTAPTAPTLTFTAAEAAMDAIATEITAAKAHHTSGVDYINAATRGADVAKTYGQYADTVMGGAGHRANESISRLREIEDTLQKYASQVTSYGSDVNAYANQVSGLVGKYREDIEAESAGMTNYSAQVQAYAAQVRAVVDEFQIKGQIETVGSQIYASEVTAYAALVRAIVDKYQAELAVQQAGISNFAAQVNKYAAQVQEMQIRVTGLLDIAGRYLASGQAKINEFMLMLGIKPEFPTTKLTSEGVM